MNRGRLVLLTVALAALLTAAATPASSGPATPAVTFSPLQTILGGRAPGVRGKKGAAGENTSLLLEPGDIVFVPERII